MWAPPQAARGFQAIVREIDPAATVEWIHADQLNRVENVGVLYLSDVTVANHARLRQRAGLAAFSLCGVTHTTASHGAMDEITDLLREAVTPWDALVCTSTSVVETVRRVHQAEAEYQQWRFGVETRPPGPQLPLIPLGLHCDDFVFSDTDRAAARAALGLEPDEVVGLFVGRLVFHAKAHLVYLQYQQLWAELNERRRAASADPALRAWIDRAPRAAPSRQDPFHVFGHYPTAEIGLATKLSLAPGATQAALKTALAHPLFGSLTTPQETVEAFFGELEAGDIAVADAAARLGTNAPTAARTAGLLLKMGMVRSV